MNRQTAILLVVLTSLCCALPGLAGLCLGSMAILGSLLPDTSVDPESVTGVIIMSVGFIMIGIFGVLAPIGVWFLGLRPFGFQPAASDPAEPIPADDF